MNLPRATTDFYAQEYRDITLNTKLVILGHTYGKSSINPNFDPFEAQNNLFLTIFGQNQTNLRMAESSTILTTFEYKRKLSKQHLENISEKSNERFPRKSTMHKRTYERMDRYDC